ALPAPRRGDRKGPRGRADEPAHSPGVRRSRTVGLRADSDRRGARVGLLWDRDLDRREHPGLAAGVARRERRAEAGMAAAAAGGTSALLVRADRARRRLRRLGDPDDGRVARRGLPTQRIEDVHHERGGGRVVRGLRFHGPGSRPPRFVGLRRAGRIRRCRRRGPPRQAGPAGNRHLRACLPRGAGARGKPVGEEGEGFKIAMRTLDLTRPGTAAGAVGVARAAFEHAIEYSKSRIQFGQPIAVNQGVNFLVADMAAEIEAARLLTWQAAWLIDQGERATLQSSYAKRVAADTAMKVRPTPSRSSAVTAT